MTDPWDRQLRGPPHAFQRENGGTMECEHCVKKPIASHGAARKLSFGMCSEHPPSAQQQFLRCTGAQ